MLSDLPLRLRILLFFLLIGLGGVAVVILAIYAGFQRTAPGADTSPFVYAALIAAFGITALVTGIWMLFDENVAKPIERLAAELRARAHGGVAHDLDLKAARYLGDLAPAALAMTQQLSRSTLDTAEHVANATANLEAERVKLTALLTESPVAMTLISPAHRIVLYDGQASQALGQIAQPRLHASIFDYLDEDTLRAAYGTLCKTGKDVDFTALGAHGVFTSPAKLKALGSAPGYMLMMDANFDSASSTASRPLVYDFDLLEGDHDSEFDARPIGNLNYTVFDTETTGLLPHKDEIVQIGAVRVVNGKIIQGETFEALVNPGMAIPAASTKVHGISDAMVVGADKITVVAPQFHGFSKDSVIVAHNAPFDMAFLRRHSKASGVTWDHPILDTVLLSAVLFGASETHTLDALCDRLKITIPQHLRHTAMGDAVATAEVLCKLLPMLKARGFDTFGKVLVQTRKHGRLLEDLN